MTRREEREQTFELLFETEFRQDELPTEIFESSIENRNEDIVSSEYIKSVYFGILDNLTKIDSAIDNAAKGWKAERISRVSRNIIRLAVYEMMYCDNIPPAVAINEAVELCKKYDEPKARPFLNGVLNAIKDRLKENAE